MNIRKIIEKEVIKGFKSIYNAEITTVEFQSTRKDFEGDITLVIFGFLRIVRGNPVEIGKNIGEYLLSNVPEIQDYNVVKGFLNLVLSDDLFVSEFNKIYSNLNYGIQTSNGNDESIIVEFSSPNTNKPLHLGHIRNNLLGYAVSNIIAASGKKVYKTQIINDRGIHICKSMLAWQKYGNGETPESTGLKGDKLVGNYYVKFDQEYKKEIGNLVNKGVSIDEAKKIAPSLLEAQEMLVKWEAGDREVVGLWKKMNQWVYDGFDQTYNSLGVNFDNNYFESDTYLLGKNIITEGLRKKVFFRKEDGSIWIDLRDEGLDEKIVLRSDGTSVYMTQDIGTAIQRIKDLPDVNGMVYTVGNEQDYHFKVLFLILEKLGYQWAQNLHHLSYGMVDLPEGKMKSREGTVVDADDLINEMALTAEEISKELGKLEGYSKEKKGELYKTIGLGALKYYILKVDPKKRILFDPKESIDFNGNTGPFIQYTYARIQSILRKADFDLNHQIKNIILHPKEKILIKRLLSFEEVILNAAESLSPALVANYSYDLVKDYNSFYQSVPILGSSDENEKVFRTQISKKVGDTIRLAFGLLGIDVPDRM